LLVRGKAPYWYYCCEIINLPINREEANLFFKLVRALHEQASLIITSNKGFEGWTELMGDAALATAVLDRLFHKCELFNMSGKSYRLEFRKSISSVIQGFGGGIPPCIGRFTSLNWKKTSKIICRNYRKTTCR